MAKSKFEKDLDKFRDNLSKLIKKQGSKKNMTMLGDEAVRLIKIRTRLGSGFSKKKKGGGLKREPLKPLSDNYIAFRKKYKKKFGLGPAATPKKSSLTLTGQLLNSLGVTKVSKKKVYIGAVEESRESPFGGSSKVKNSEVIEAQEKQGRIFLQLSDLDIKKMYRFFNNLLKKDIKKNPKL